MSGTTKGVWKRPTLNQQLADLGEQIWREKDVDKQELLVKEWEMLKEQQWKITRENNPHLWGEKEK